MFRPRAIEPLLRDALVWSRVLLLVGPRQAGKSTLAARVTFDLGGTVARLDDPTTGVLAATDPRSLVETQRLLMIDEVQLVPALFRAIKLEVDLDPTPGRFLLTGSARLAALPALADALVGRMDVLELHPFSGRELEGRPGTVIDSMFDDPASLTRSPPQPLAIDALLTGGFPEAIRRGSPRARTSWHRSYADALVHRASEELGGVSDAATLRRTLQSLALRSGTLLNIDGLARDLAIPPTTLRRHLDLLVSAYALDLVPAWSTNLVSRSRKAPKIHLIDPGLMASLSGVTSAGLRRDRAQLGRLLESAVFAELRRQAALATQPVTFHHLRVEERHEVDLLLERADGTVVAIEIKAGRTVQPDDTRSLRLLADRAPDRFRAGFVLSMADPSGSLGDGCYAIGYRSLTS